MRAKGRCSGLRRAHRAETKCSPRRMTRTDGRWPLCRLVPGGHSEGGRHCRHTLLQKQVPRRPRQGPQHKSAEQRVDKSFALPSSAAVGADFMPLFRRPLSTARNPRACVAVQYERLPQISTHEQSAGCCETVQNPLLCVEGEEEAVDGEGEEGGADSQLQHPRRLLPGQKAVKHLFVSDPAYLPLDYRLQLVGAELDTYDAEIFMPTRGGQEGFTPSCSPSCLLEDTAATSLSKTQM